MHSPDDRKIRTRTLSQWAWLLFSLGLAIAIVASACTDDGSVTPAARATASRAGSGNSSANSTLIQQPLLGRWKRLTRGKLALKSERVDLEMPSFSYPTSITNPLFPISDLHSALALGHVDGEQLKVETTLLPETKIAEWNGQRVETLQSQFLAYHDVAANQKLSGYLDSTDKQWQPQSHPETLSSVDEARAFGIDPDEVAKSLV